jgi:hypothetical protein
MTSDAGKAPYPAAKQRSPHAYDVSRGGRNEIGNDDFAPGGRAKPRAATASLSNDFDLTPRTGSHPHRQAGPFRCRPTVHWGWLDLLRLKIGSEGSLRMDGADHVNRDKILVQRRGSLDLENGRLAEGHAAPMDGQDFEAVDRPGFPLECYF